MSVGHGVPISQTTNRTSHMLVIAAITKYVAGDSGKPEFQLAAATKVIPAHVAYPNVTNAERGIR